MKNAKEDKVKDKSNVKDKVRRSKEWKELRKKIQSQYNGKDPITNSNLYKGFIIHHLDMSIENYDNLSIERFVPLNKMTHDTIHFLYRYYRKDKHILERIREVLERMLEYECTI